MRIALIGWQGFVGSAFARFFEARGIPFTGVDRSSYARQAGTEWDLAILAAANSKKFVAEETPLAELEQSLELTSRILRDFPARRHLLLSTVDVYNELASRETTRETTPIDLEALGNYGFHKRLSELLVLRHSPHPLVFRLAGMVGPGLKKNPVFDVCNHLPIRIHPDSRYQFLHTERVAEIVWDLQAKLPAGEILNVCGAGLISPREIAAMAGTNLDTSQVSGPPRIVDICIDKLAGLARVQSSADAVVDFLKTTLPRNGHHTHTPPG
jgi:nucleoside-diphosphate-sugar epimerase